mmetsp:Transcript_4877/g.11664  ORF Transcript_4877/g.11664 Transcript_4877/m.11664 type:complete len:362 (-) Transcript_4877:1962-3047(-)
MESLQRVDQYSGDLTLAHLNDIKGRWIKILESNDISSRALISGDSLHAIPPTMVGPTEHNNHFPVLVESRQTRSAHDSFCATHMKRNLSVWFPSNLSEHVNVLFHHRMQWAKNATKLPDFLDTGLHEFLVVIVPAHIYAVRTGNVNGLVAIDVLQPVPLGFGDNGCRITPSFEMLSERQEHSVGGGKAKIREALFELLRHFERLWELFAPLFVEAFVRLLALLGNLLAAAIGSEEHVLGERVCRDQIGDNSDHHGQAVCLDEGEQHGVDPLQRNKDHDDRKESHSIICETAVGINCEAERGVHHVPLGHRRCVDKEDEPQDGGCRVWRLDVKPFENQVGAKQHHSPEILTSFKVWQMDDQE